MDYYQGVVAEYLRANRATFVNTEFWLSLRPDEKDPPKGTSWFVDILAVSFLRKTAFLCEITYSANQTALLKKLSDWATQWSEIQLAILRDAYLPIDWRVELWLFIPENKLKKFQEKLPKTFSKAKITCLEKTVPWVYNNHAREDVDDL